MKNDKQSVVQVYNPYYAQLGYSSIGAQSKHIHVFTDVTSIADGHRHQYTGTTEPSLNTLNHTHKYFAVTQYEDEHRHLLIGETGPAIQFPNGGHTHEIKGETYGYTIHQHFYSGYSSVVNPESKF